ncbi:hypothetical protein M8J75_004661 [Diaphorina citri]|nr:hypothetical protein M8J75_004661 [Diaphorina citri]
MVQQKCANVEWIKPGGFQSIAVVGPDVIALHSCSYILFFPPDGPRIDYEASTKANGLGVQCLAGYVAAPLFAFAEKAATKPRLLVKSFPGFETISVLSDNKLGEFMFLEFSENECIVALKGLPSYEIQLWSWRTGEKMMYKKTGLTLDRQILRVTGSSGGQISVAQLAPGSNWALVWEFTKCYNQCVAQRKPLRMREGGVDGFVDVCWTVDNVVVLLDEKCNVYRIDDDLPVRLITQTKSVEGTYKPHMIGFKQGLVIFCANGDIQFWVPEGSVTKGQNQVWIKESELVQSEHVIEMVTLYPIDTDCTRLIGWSHQGCLVSINLGTSSIESLHEFGCGFTTLVLLEPDETHVVTLNTKQELCIWLLSSGKLTGKLSLGADVGSRLYPHPLLPYLCALENPGLLLLVDCRRPVLPTLASRIALCPGPLDEMQFSVNGASIVAVNCEQGLIIEIDSSFSDLSWTRIAHRILSFCMESAHYLFVLVQDSQFAEPGGNTIFQYSLLDFSLVQVLRSVQHLLRIYEVPTKFELMALLPRSRLLMFCRYFKYEQNLQICKILNSTQQLREFQTRIYGDQVLCYGRDGLVSLLSMKDGRVECTQVEHHWKNRGVKTGVLSKHGHIVSLGYSTTLICTRLKQRPSVEPKHDPPSPHAPSPPRALDVPFPLLAELEDKLSFHNLSWLEFKQNEKVNEDKIKYRTKLADLHRDFRIVQLKVQALLDKNITGPSEERLDLIEFDINAERKARALEAAQGACEAYRMTHEELIESWKHQRDLIRRLCWDAMKVKTRAVYGIDRPNLQVENFGFPQPDPQTTARYNKLIERKEFDARIVTKSFYPWDVKALEKFENPPQEAATDDGLTYERPLVRLVTPRADETPAGVQARRNEWFGSKVTENLRLHFNEEFDQLFKTKEQTIDLIHQQTARLRDIQQDLVFPCNSSYPELPRSEVKMTQEELVEMILEVLDEEQALIDERLAEEERLRRLAAMDNFKERALMEMMDGVLELKWEDKLKKDVPKPPCMIKKVPDKWNEQDLNDVKEYEYKVEEMRKDRAKYKESIQKFDDNLFTLYSTKLKIEQAIHQEHLKILRIMCHSKEAYAIDEDYAQLQDTLTFLEQQELPVAMSVVNHLQTTLAECKSNYESFVVKDKALDKKFRNQLKNEYSTSLSKPQLDQMYKLYRKMPKLKIISCPDIWCEMAEHIINPHATSFLLADALDVIRGVDQLDKQAFQMSNIDMKVVEFVTRNRRLKIESDFKMRAAGLELAEAEATVQYHTRNVTSVKDRILHIKTQLAHMIGYQNDLEQDIIIQLNLCQGQVEMELTGHFEDFHRVHLITKNTINNINTKVKRAGSMKIAETQKSCRMRKMIVNQEWVQKKLKMSIENLKAHIKRTDRTKISRETLEFLRNEERGCVAKDTWLAKTDRDAEAMIAYYRDESDRLDAKLEAIEAKKLKLKHSLKEIDTRAREVHLSVSLTKMEKDKDFEEEYEQSRKARMAALLKRCTLVQKIQALYCRLDILRTELSTLRCKTYPILKPQPEPCPRD